jgi:DNA-binding NarL/FixJ family response regulator
VSQENKPTVLIAEDDFIIREGLLKSMLEPEFDIVASVDDGHDAVLAAAEHHPAVVLLDVSLPGLRGFEAAQQIHEADPACKILLVSNYLDPSYPATAQAIGASGYVLKSRTQNELIPAIHSVLAGEFYQSVF